MNSLFYLIFLTPIFFLLEFQAEASPTGSLIKHLSSFIKWTMPSPGPPHTDENLIQFENGYLMETVVERGNKLGVEPYSIRVSPEGELFAIDAVNSNIVKISPPLSQFSRARLVAGSFEGYSGHVDGRPSDARFNHPKHVTVDDKGNVYVADTLNLAIRKIGEAGVTTIAGGKSNVAGYRDGPSEDAKFSTDFDVVFIRHTCSLLVVDRGNAALRQISLHQEDCEHQNGSISSSDIIMVVGAVLVGYASCMLQHGFGPYIFSKSKQTTESKFEEMHTVEKPTPVETSNEDMVAGWPSLGQLITDLSKLAFEALGSLFLQTIPLGLLPGKSRKGLSPIKDTLMMPDDKVEPLLSVHEQRILPPLDETTPIPNSSTDVTHHKPQNSKIATGKDPSPTSSKHRSSKRHDISEHRSAEATQYGLSISKSQKDRSRHRSRGKSGEIVSGVTGLEPKPIEIKSVDYDDPKFDHYNIRSKQLDEHLFHF